MRVRRRVFPWPNEPTVRTSEPALQRLFDASVNTLNNCAQETLVDGMARERQQYSGDGGHQMHAVHLAFGEPRLVARYLTTWSQGMTKDGYFLDCWPAYDRLARLMERQLDLTGWGPILDHGVGFNFDCWNHYLYTGDSGGSARAVSAPAPLRPVPAGPRRARDGLLPVEDLGIPSVWIDHVAYQRQRHKQCAFNLYAAAAMQHALAPICRAFGDAGRRRRPRVRPTSLLDGDGAEVLEPRARLSSSTTCPGWPRRKPSRTCDRSLATAVLFDQCPGGRTPAALRSLADCPPRWASPIPATPGGASGPWPRAVGRTSFVKDLRDRWATMASVKENNTLQEDWQARHDSGQQWSHCAVVPLYIAYHGLAGLRPLLPGFKRFELRPQFADLEDLDLTAFTVAGPIHFSARGRGERREVAITLPAGCPGEIVVPGGQKVDLEPAPGTAPLGHQRLLLPAGRETRLTLA